MKIKAVIDIGSNSIKMRAGYKDESGKIIIIHDETEVVKLGRGMNLTGMLARENMLNALKALTRMISTAEKLEAEIFIAGTMALRTAKNSNEFIKLVHDSTGRNINILTGLDEAKFSRLGALDGLGGESSIVFDTGGGSTEFIAGGEKIASVPVGAVTITDKFFNDNNRPVYKSEWDAAYKYIHEKMFEYKIQDFKNDSSGQVIGVGGGLAVMASVKLCEDIFMPLKLHGMSITQKDIVKQAKLYSSLNLSERQKIIGLPASRADVVLGSACIVLCALRILEANSCIVSINGLRHGILISECGRG